MGSNQRFGEKDDPWAPITILPGALLAVVLH